LQLRFDARNIIMKRPQFGRPQNDLAPGGVLVAPGGTAGGLQVTVGLGFNLK
jgi:hypothetical protein